MSQNPPILVRQARFGRLAMSQRPRPPRELHAGAERLDLPKPRLQLEAEVFHVKQGLERESGQLGLSVPVSCETPPPTSPQRKTAGSVSGTGRLIELAAQPQRGTIFTRFVKPRPMLSVSTDESSARVM
jgi:hypothetical protein